MRSNRSLPRLAAGLALAGVFAAPASASARETAPVVPTVANGRFEIPSGDGDGSTLTVAGPSGFRFRQSFPKGTPPSMPLRGPSDAPLADGAYRWEVLDATPVSPATREALAAARADGDEQAIERILRDGLLSTGPASRSGSFRVVAGVAVFPGAEEGSGSPRDPAAPEPPLAATVIPNDLVVNGSACLGVDCSDTEVFGLDTLRLEENNTRIKFLDTSVAPFATHDWTLEANDNASGGLDRFSIRDEDAATTPFTVEGGSRSAALYVDSSGRIGFGTLAPVMALHMLNPNTPGVRLEQTSGGFGTYTWDVAGNEANFFVRDVSAGNKLPFRIKPAAPTDSLVVATDGAVGVGTSAPNAPLHVARSDGSAELRVVENSLVNASRTLLTLRNNGPIVMKYADSSNGTSWIVKQGNGAFVFSNAASGQQELKLNNDTSIEMGASGGTARFRLDPAGNVAISGTLSQGSDRASKIDVAPVDAELVLDKVAALPVSTWRYRADAGSVRHMGPMAQDFAAAFELGDDDRRIGLGDVGGVALAAVQGLSRRVDARSEELRSLRRRNEELERRNADLERRLDTLERRLAPASGG